MMIGKVYVDRWDSRATCQEMTGSGYGAQKAYIDMGGCGFFAIFNMFKSKRYHRGYDYHAPKDGRRVPTSDEDRGLWVAEPVRDFFFWSSSIGHSAALVTSLVYSFATPVTRFAATVPRPATTVLATAIPSSTVVVSLSATATHHPHVPAHNSDHSCLLPDATIL
ncbi:hypothetical protein TEA_011523 [Camellia sinensis var. sinensis]|uniref:Uncharacterized protein n=1 Tax=Camellia sinensis var. sinensis TaxID=542762 RepID=A0A4V3WNC8_CAMSN|nr:hypothetical protein TEA_011523 [Camellia sinensis var. sinensis]